MFDLVYISEHVIVHYRFIFVMFLLPVSCLYDLWFYTRSKIVFALSSAPNRHKEKVAHVQQQVRDSLFDKTVSDCTTQSDCSMNDRMILHFLHR